MAIEYSEYGAFCSVGELNEPGYMRIFLLCSPPLHGAEAESEKGVGSVFRMFGCLWFVEEGTHG